MVGDIWVSGNLKHTGIVSSIALTGDSKKQRVFIMHASSDQHKVAPGDEWPNHWKRLKGYVPGTFYRYGKNAAPSASLLVDELIVPITN